MTGAAVPSAVPPAVPSAVPPLVLPLDDPGAVPAVAGGKGASLARLARAGFRVPPGFVVTTGAYLYFVRQGGLLEPMQAALSAAGGADVPGGAGEASARIGELFSGQPLPAATAAAITAAYAALGDDVPVAVRSSATAEDLPGLSAAGQHDTYLGIRGEAAVLDAVRRCWASLWSERAIGYRARFGIAPGDVSIAVVVQRLVPADAAGVMFTVDPVSGARDRVVISANWGLGESVVAGDVTPDVAVVDRASGTLVSYQVGSKETMTVADGPAARSADTPAGLRSDRVLADDQAAELVRIGLAAEELYGEPVDVEWALAAGEFSVVQARPVTTAATPSAGLAAETWNDSLDGDYLWSNGNLGEAIPDVMTPATWSFVELLMTRMTFPPHLPDFRGYGRVGGRFYVNVSMSISLEALAGVPPRRFVTFFGPVLGKLPPVEDIPRPRLPRAKVIRQTVATGVTMLRRVRPNSKRMPEFLAGAPARCDRLQAEIKRTTDAAALARLWPEQLRPLIVEACDMLTAAVLHGTTLVRTPAKLAALVGEADAALLLSGQQAGGSLLASLGPVTGLARLARGEIDRDAFARQYGHRGAHEIELSTPRPAEDPGWIDDLLAAAGDTALDPDALLASQEVARAAALDRLVRQDPRKAAGARKLIARWAPLARNREAARSEVTRTVWVARTWVRRAGQLTGHGDDLFFLGLPEIFDLLSGDLSRGDPAPLAEVAARRAVYETYRPLPLYPTLIRGRFDPVRWAADPGRRSDYYDERTEVTSPDETITGFPGAAGVVEGTARVLREPEEAAQLGDGEILVTTVTNIGWTPVFPRAAAVVTDVGAPLSHAAIVARELGIPAVVGCGNATTLLHSGDRVRVDGSHGTVEVLHQA
ncbi:MAG: PEP/pyruvate-binding domain-containing protein [Streptosporangiaceae bacterium]